MARFRLGERVRYIGEEGNEDCRNQCATIIYVREYDDFDSGYDYGVKFDNYLCVHNCGGRCDNGYGLWANEDQLEKLEEEIKMEFKNGDRVEYIGGGRLNGKLATICNMESPNSIGICFDESMDGHDCYRTCEYGHGWWVTSKEIKLIKEEKKKMIDISKIKNKLIVNFGDEYYSSEYKIVKVKSYENVIEGGNTPRFAEIIADKFVVLNKYNHRIYGALNTHIEDALIEANCNNWRLDGETHEEISVLTSGFRDIVVDLDTGNYYDYVPEGFERCKHCGRLVKKSQLIGERCDFCIVKSGGLAYRFGYHEYSSKFRLLDKKPIDTKKVVTLGCEIERDYLGGYGSDFEKDLHNATRGVVRCMYTPKELEGNQEQNRKINFSEDGSLTNRGCEAVVHYASQKWYEKNSDKLQNMLDIFKQFNFGNSHNCGNHIHIGKDFFEGDADFCSAKMALLINAYWDEFLAIGKREETDYCAMPKHKRGDTTSELLKKTYKDSGESRDAYDEEGEHNTAVNMQHKNTIELRFWSGIDDVDDLLLYIDITQSLAKYVKKASLEKCQTTKLADIFKYMSNKKKHIPMIIDRLNTCKYNDELRELIKEVK